MSHFRVPFNRAYIAGNEVRYCRQALGSGHISGDGSFSRRCHMLLEEQLAVSKALLTTSGTHALEMAALLLDIGPGDEVILPSFTFVSTANAFVLRGARPVFADIRPDTLNLDEERLPALITDSTKAIIVVHYAGVGCEMDAVMKTAGRSGVAVVEDNAHGLFGTYRERYLGTFGCLAAQSFHETKNFTCGEGGALLINDRRYVERAEVIREKGTDRSRFFRGQVDKYTWVDVGSSYLPAEPLAAILLAQLEAREEIQRKRRVIWESYQAGLSRWAEDQGVVLPFVPSSCGQSYHLFYLLLPSFSARQGLIDHLEKRGIMSIFHYQPLHLSVMGRRYGGREGDCPVTEDISERIVRLPFYTALKAADQSYVIDAIRDFKA